jgi:hypothetical protein
VEVVVALIQECYRNAAHQFWQWRACLVPFKNGSDE